MKLINVSFKTELEGAGNDPANRIVALHNALYTITKQLLSPLVFKNMTWSGTSPSGACLSFKDTFSAVMNWIFSLVRRYDRSITENAVQQFFKNKVCKPAKQNIAKMSNPVKRDCKSRKFAKKCRKSKVEEAMNVDPSNNDAQQINDDEDDGNEDDGSDQDVNNDQDDGNEDERNDQDVGNDQDNGNEDVDNDQDDGNEDEGSEGSEGEDDSDELNSQKQYFKPSSTPTSTAPGRIMRRRLSANMNKMKRFKNLIASRRISMDK